MTDADAWERDVFLATRILGHLRPNDKILVGSGLRVARAAAWQAARKWDTVRLASGMRWTRPGADSLTPLPLDFGTAPEGSIAYSEYRHDRVMLAARDTPTIFFVGGIEVGVDGATNMWGVPREGGWRTRGLGAVGTMCMTTWSDRHIVILPRLHERSFVDEVSLTTVPGRRTGRGPIEVVSPDAAFTFDADGVLRVSALGPGRTLADVESMTQRPWSVLVDGPGVPGRSDTVVNDDDVEALRVLLQAST